MPLLQVNGHRASCRGILFDKDGTLLHFMALWGGWADYVLRYMEEHLGLMGAEFTVPRERVLGTVHDSGGAVTDYDVQGPLAMGSVEETTGMLAWQLYAAGMPWDEAILQVNRITNDALLQIRQHKPAFPMPGLDAFLQSCRKAGLELAVVTSDTTAAALEHLEWMGIRSFFPVVLGRDQVKNSKPHPEIAEKACRMLGLEPGEVVVIGDSNADMLMARQAGAAMAVGLCRGDGEGDHLVDAEVVISDYNEIKIVD
ncbi:HAD family hydrolase [Paenibacillus faecalis]|uniref:HAD family hydrolase n=1 Tax=Paenibacillus faecalis TaxID=2079532 RepID=UPI000D0FB646|nr:HAD family hydrolase [Paenibacillus faecalis]